MTTRTGSAVAALSAVIAVACTLAACGGSGSAAPTVPATTTPGVTLSTEASPVGPILATGSGHTLYEFASDSATHSACQSASCTYVWPPLTVVGAPTVAHGLHPALAGTLRRPDGDLQVTYGGHPLYTYTSDGVPGSVTGQGVNQSGGLWYVVGPNGRAITTTFSVSGLRVPARGLSSRAARRRRPAGAGRAGAGPRGGR